MSRRFISQMSEGFQGPGPPPGSSPPARATRLETSHSQLSGFPRPVPGLTARPWVRGQRWGARLSQRRRAWPVGAIDSTRPAGLQRAGERTVRAALDPGARSTAAPPTTPRLPRWIPSCPSASPGPQGTGDTHIWGFSSKQPARPPGRGPARQQGLSADSPSWAVACRWKRGCRVSLCPAAVGRGRSHC